MMRRGLVLALVLLAGPAAFAADSPQSPAPARRTAADEQRSLLNQMAEWQQWTGEQIWHIRRGIDEVPDLVNQLKDADAARQSEVDKLRDEVKGLYVETSSLRQQLDELKTEIAGVNDNVSGFRTFAGFFIAVMILLLAIVFVMTVRR
jgi:septal ring factor EnvC (AmiA/AmiB activator)